MVSGKNLFFTSPFCRSCHTDHGQHQKKHFRADQIGQKHQQHGDCVFPDKVPASQLDLRGIEQKCRRGSKKGTGQGILGKHQMLQKQPSKNKAFRQRRRQLSPKAFAESKAPVHNQKKTAVMAKAQEQPIPGKRPPHPVQQTYKSADHPQHLNVAALRGSGVSSRQNILHQHVIIQVIVIIKPPSHEKNQDGSHDQRNQPVFIF